MADDVGPPSAEKVEMARDILRKVNPGYSLDDPLDLQSTVKRTFAEHRQNEIDVRMFCLSEAARLGLPTYEILDYARKFEAFIYGKPLGEDDS